MEGLSLTNPTSENGVELLALVRGTKGFSVQGVGQIPEIQVDTRKDEWGMDSTTWKIGERRTEEHGNPSGVVCVFNPANLKQCNQVLDIVQESIYSFDED